ncbi:putative LysE/RhtB family amino acid efflux pump [Rhizobium sp. BK529]|uniref:LysE family translocator n=1 Tax=unclassified Rhizobium TaxID=2613769 RepID=UPI0010498E31|nr:MULTISPECIES: LysE family transporter [unclassified Rhizobium]MBB3591151.1 putative LysE/RhtB family amino acid efflux pump [Rhizobium sp. BK529]TCS08894.1 putative LysE/RhtB family amino acid efflux pump [Rhizobium sp. BK418]
MLFLFLKGALLGVIITAPLGPIGTLCINRSLEKGFWFGFSGGLGTALGDATYALVAVAGLAVFSETMSTATIPLALGGGMMLLWLGWRGLQNRGIVKAAKIDAADFLHTTISTFLLTISNPATILSFGALFAGFGLTEETRRYSSAVIVSGVFIGSLLWWFCLSAAVSVARDRLSSDFTARVGRATSYMLIAFGAVALGSVAYSIV